MAEWQFTADPSSVRFVAEQLKAFDRNREDGDSDVRIGTNLLFEAMSMLEAYASALELYRRQRGPGTWGAPEAEHDAAKRWREQGRNEVKQAVRRALRPKRKRR